MLLSNAFPEILSLIFKSEAIIILNYIRFSSLVVVIEEDESKKKKKKPLAGL